MCIACEMAFMGMLEALAPEEQERILREHERATRFACDTPQEVAPEPPKEERTP